MFAEEINNTSDNSNIKNNFTLEKGGSKNAFINYIMANVKYFLNALNKHPNRSKLNENDLTQIFVEQLDNFLVYVGSPFGVKNQYSDTFFKTTGIPDFYFHSREIGVHLLPFFIVESKRLPSKTFQTEYVIGENKNGGIERFKIGKHGFGLIECGMVGFIEKEDYSFWNKEVNSWINNLTKINSDWNKKECLKKGLNSPLYSCFTSNIISTLTTVKELHHVWIDIRIIKPTVKK